MMGIRMTNSDVASGGSWWWGGLGRHDFRFPFRLPAGCLQSRLPVGNEALAIFGEPAAVSAGPARLAGRKSADRRRPSMPGRDPLRLENVDKWTRIVPGSLHHGYLFVDDHIAVLVIGSRADGRHYGQVHSERAVG
jgi:hypothetical protein